MFPSCLSYHASARASKFKLTHYLRLFLVTILAIPVYALGQNQPATKPATPTANNSAVSPATQAAAAPAVPSLSTADKIAIEACETAKQDAQKKFIDAQQQELSILREFGAAHPGFTVNQQNFAVEPLKKDK